MARSYNSRVLNLLKCMRLDTHCAAEPPPPLPEGMEDWGDMGGPPPLPPHSPPRDQYAYDWEMYGRGEALYGNVPQLAMEQQQLMLLRQQQLQQQQLQQQQRQGWFGPPGFGPPFAGVMPGMMMNVMDPSAAFIAAQQQQQQYQAEMQRRNQGYGGGPHHYQRR
jgi:hypothetical protein